MTKSKRFLHFLRSIILSYEFVIFLLWFPIHKHIEPYFNNLLKSNNTNEVIKYFGFLPGIILAFSTKESSGILRPFEGDKLKIFLQWPLYTVFKDKVYSNLMIQMISAVSAIYSFMSFDANKTYYFIIIIFACIISLIAVASNNFGGGVELKNNFDLSYEEVNKSK